MPTNPIGKGTMTVSINVPIEWGAILGRLSVQEDRSKGDIVRRALERGLSETHPVEAAQLTAAREHHRAVKAGICLAVVILAVGLQFNILTKQDPFRRCQFRSRAAIRREVLS